MTKRFVSINYSIQGEVQLAKAIDFIGAEIQDFSSPLQKSKDMLLKTFDVNFLKNGNTLGEPWQGLAPSTIIDKFEKYGNRRTLEATGGMRKSFYGTSNSERLVIENLSPHFKYHQSNQARKKIPRRVMMKIDAKRGREITRNFVEYISEIRSHTKAHKLF